MRPHPRLARLGRYRSSRLLGLLLLLRGCLLGGLLRHHHLRRPHLGLGLCCLLVGLTLGHTWLLHPWRLRSHRGLTLL